MVRLMAVAIDDHDVAGGQERLHGHLVRGRSAVGDEEGMIRTKGACSHLLRLLDIAGRLQKAVKTTGCGAAFGEEQVYAVELAHVADPVGIEHRLATRNRQGVEGADWPLRIFLQVVEEWGFKSRLHALKHR